MRAGLRWLFRGLAVIAALLASIQPFLGSFAFFRPSEAVDYESVHLVMGGLLYNAALALTVLAPFTRFRRRWPLFGICLAQYGLTHLQLRLGLGSNEDATLLSYHIPVGVLIVLVAYLTVALAFGFRLDSRAT